MSAKQKMLFGIHDLESARQSLEIAGRLLRKRKEVNITLFHGSPDPKLSTLAKLLRLTPEAVEEYRKTCSLEEKKVLELAKAVLVESGFDPGRVATICEACCHDPAAAMMNLANAAGLEPILLARRKEPLLQRLLMGAVTYRVVQLAEWRSLWLFDPPLATRDILVTVVGAPISRRVVEHAATYFSHLEKSRFTLLHIIPPVPPIYWDHTRIFDNLERKEREISKSQWQQAYSERVEEIAAAGKESFRRAGIAAKNVAVKILPARRGMAGDILSELENGRYGVLVLGRKGSKELSPFRLGSIASKLLHNAQNCIICLVN